MTWPLAAPLLALSQVPAAPSGPPEQIAESLCRTVRPTRTFERGAIAGVPLVSGLVTGMSKDVAKEVAPKLAARSDRVKLFDDLSLVGHVQFILGAVHAVEFTGSPANAPIEVLTRHLGPPSTSDFEWKSEDLPSSDLPINHRNVSSRNRLLSWCDGPRLLVLNINDDFFRLAITAPPVPKVNR